MQQIKKTSRDAYLSVPSGGLNPFIGQIEARMIKLGWRSHHASWNYRNIYALKDQVGIVHIHWPEALWRSNSRAVSLARCLHFIAKALLSRILGYKLVWSAHNVMPHACRSLFLEKFMRRWILKTFDLVIGHALNCEADLREAFGSSGRRYATALLGHYDQLYFSSRLPAEMRRHLGLDEKERVIVLLANWQPYKGHDRFLRVFIAQAWPNLRLLVIGPKNPDLATALQHPAVIHIERRLSDSELADHMTAVDFIALPYRHITTSSAFLLAVTLGKGVIAPDLPFFQLHSEPGMALLYPHGNPEQGLRDALARISHGWRPDQKVMDKMRERYSWDDSCAVMAHEFDKLVQPTDMICPPHNRHQRTGR